MDGLANGNKRGKLTDDATNDNVDWRIAERVAFEQMVCHTHTHNALQGELRSPQEALRDVSDLTSLRKTKPAVVPTVGFVLLRFVISLTSLRASFVVLRSP